MVAIRDLLRELEPQFKNILFGFGVVMPREHFSSTGAEMIPEVLLDKREFHFNFGRYIAKLEKYWSEICLKKHSREYRAPTVEQIRLARKLLRPNVDSAYSIGGYLGDVQAQILQLSNDQIRTSRRIAANPRTIVRGLAGTGKTVIAIERARMLSQQGYRVLYLCFNKLLAAHIRRGFAKEGSSPNVHVVHAHALYSDVIKKCGMAPRLEACDASSPDFFSKEFPQLFIDAMIESEAEQWDVLIVDEAQDLLTPDNLDAFDVLLRDGLTNGRWHFFLDPKQNIYSSFVQAEVEARLVDTHPTYDDLVENCRNTKQVAVQASILSGIDLALQGAPEGNSCDNIYYSDKSDFLSQLDALVARLLRRDVRPSEIAILSTRKREHSLIAGKAAIGGCQIIDALEDVAYSESRILFSTMHAFKGLERPVVIAIDMENIGQVQWSMLHYAGLSRACALLRTFLPNRCKDVFAVQAKAFGERLAPV
jgi:hypothetical protein